MHIVSKRQFIFLALFSVSLLTISCVIVNNREHARSDAFVLVTFFINIVIVYFKLINSVKDHQFSFDAMFWLFSFFFFCIAPLLQYLSGCYSWNFKPVDLEIIKTNILLMIWFIFYLIGRWLGNKKFIFNKKPVYDFNYRHTTYYCNKNALRFLLGVSILIVLYYLVRIGFKGMMVQSTNVDSSIDSKAMALLTNHGFHNLLTFSATLHIIDAKLSRLKLSTVVAVMCFFIGCFPTGISRNMMASFYAGMLIIVFDSAREKRWMTWAIFAGLILIFPAINLFRNLSILNSDSTYQYILLNIQNTYLNGDYDAHQMFISIQRWVHVDGFSWGRQLLGAIFFFVPRSIWANKAVGTGQTAFIVLKQYWYTNVSAPLPSEGYVNFGIPGIIVFAIIIGYFVHRIDVKYWNERDPLSNIRVIYPFLMFMFFFVCRGDLQSTGSYFVAQAFVGTVVYKFVVRKNEIIKCI